MKFVMDKHVYAPELTRVGIRRKDRIHWIEVPDDVRRSIQHASDFKTLQQAMRKYFSRGEYKKFMYVSGYGKKRYGEVEGYGKALEFLRHHTDLTLDRIESRWSV